METTPTSPDFNPLEEDGFDIKRWLSLFMSNWYWFAIALFIAMSLAYLINRYSQKIYTVSSTMLIKDDKYGGNAANMIPGGGMFNSQMNLSNEIGIIKSLSLNYIVMKELRNFHVVYRGVGRRKVVESDLYTGCPFRVVYESTDNQPKGVVVNIEILSEEKYHLMIDGYVNMEKDLNFGERFTNFGFDFIIEPREPGRTVYTQNSSNTYYFYFTDIGSLASTYGNKLNITPINKDATIVNLSVSGPVLQQEMDYLNKLMEVYIRLGLDNKNRTADSTIRFIDKQLVILSDSLNKAEDKLENFRSQNRFINLSSEGSRIQSKVERVESEKSGFQMQLQYFKYLSDYIASKNTSSTLISPSLMGISDPLLTSLLNRFLELRNEIEKLGINFSGEQPASAFLRKQMEEVYSAISESIRNNIANLKLLIAESDRNISIIEVEIDKLPAMERKLLNIQRKVDLNNTIYTYLLEKSSESSIAKASNIPDNRVIDIASSYSSALIKPTKKKNLTIAIILGLLTPMGLIILIDLLNDKIIDKKDIERKTKIPVIGYIGHKEGAGEIPVAEKPGSALAESFRSIRTSIKYYVKENETAVISITSTISSEGKTFISVNLAAIIAMLGKKVLIVGLDLRKPRMNRVFETHYETGMSNYLSGNCTYEEVIQKTGIENLYFAPSGPRPPNPSELIETGHMKKFIERAKSEFDYLIIDTPPVGLVTDALLLSKYTDVNLFIVRQRFTSRNSLEMMDQLSTKGELRNVAIIMNDITLKGYYGYGVRYGYAHGYGYYYGYAYYGSRYYGGYGYGKRKSRKAKGYYTED
jgi:tyrosine-protein kinase Etk/Wzc